MKKQIKEIKKMQLLAGLITESEYREAEEKVNEVNGLENDDLIYDNMVSMDIEQLVSNMLSTVESNPSITLKDYLLKYDYSDNESEYRESSMNEANNLPIDGELIGNKFHVDFDDLGNLWAEKFEEEYGHEYDDLNDEDNDNFAIIQDKTVKDLESILSQMYGKSITLKYMY
jgi:cobalamin biosynthesis protein CobT